MRLRSARWKVVPLGEAGCHTHPGWPESNGSGCRSETSFIVSVHYQNSSAWRNGAAVLHLQENKEGSQEMVVDSSASLLCSSSLKWRFVFPPSVSKHLSTFGTTCFPSRLSTPHLHRRPVPGRGSGQGTSRTALCPASSYHFS